VLINVIKAMHIVVDTDAMSFINVVGCKHKYMFKEWYLKLDCCGFLHSSALCFCLDRHQDCLMESNSAALSSLWLQHASSSTSTMSTISDLSTVNSRLACSANSSATSDSRPVVISSDSGIFTEILTSASEHQTGDAHASRPSSSQSVDRLDSSCADGAHMQCCSESCTDRPTSALPRGVQIVEYPRWNPKPLLSANMESLQLMEEYLCPRKLVSVKLETSADIQLELHSATLTLTFDFSNQKLACGLLLQSYLKECFC